MARQEAHTSRSAKCRRRCHPRLRSGGRTRFRGRGLGADHRLPLRDGPGHSHRDPGRHRARRAARHRDQGPGGPRVDPRHRHDRAGQDRHRHNRPDEPGEGDRRSRGGRRRTAAAGRRAGRRLRASDRRRHRIRRPGQARRPARRAGLRERPGPRCVGRRQLPRRGGRPGGLAGIGMGVADPGGARRVRRSGGGSRADRGVRRLGRAGPRRARGRRHDQAHLGRSDPPAARDGPAAGAAHRRQRPRRPGRRRGRGHRAR